MCVLLDTHAFIWWVTNDSQLSDAARSCIADPDNDVFLSTASAWEIVIKVSIGKLILPEPPESYIPSRLASNQFERSTAAHSSSKYSRSWLAADRG